MADSAEKPIFSAALDAVGYDSLLPMNIIISATGHILHAGPTISKIYNNPLIGLRFLEVFELRRPSGITSLAPLRRNLGRTLHLNFRNNSSTRFKAVASSFSNGEEIIVNLSFGISVIDAVRDFSLTSADFAATDLAVEMLYLVEAKTAVLDELRELNGRLDIARLNAEEQATTDGLTGLRNRRALDVTLKRYVDKGERFGLMHLDLDFFKDVNDTLGHAAGDFVLENVARILEGETREADTVARAGGDEFVILFPRFTDPSQLCQIAGRIIERLEVAMIFEGKECKISGSAGITVTDFYKTLDVDKMLADADAALYASKHRGRAQATIWSQDLAN